MHEDGYYCFECGNQGTIPCFCGGDFCVCGDPEPECPCCANYDHSADAEEPPPCHESRGQSE